jgi:hypothetical protein
MISVRMNNLELNRILNNAVGYSQGFLEGIEMEKLQFNRILGGVAAEALGEYIDSKARMNPYSLHHVYEWNRTGDRSSRLFKFNVNAQRNFITIFGNFLPSNSVSSEGSSPFKNKAEVMESGISIVIEPKNSSVLVFEGEDGTVFTQNAIYIEHPGGDQVAGSFGEVVDEFFQQYFTSSILSGLLADLSNPEEFSRYFPEGAKSGGRSAGVVAGRKYLRVKGVEK